MNRITRLLAIVLVLLLLTAAWIWWNQPRKVDMAAYVPADSLIYVESNNLADIAGALMDTEAWRSLGPSIGMKSDARWNNWLTSLARVTGIGSTQSVIAARSQVALVMLDLNSTTGDNTLDLKPLAALVVETHTSSTRIKPAIEELVGAFARRAFGQPSVERVVKDNHEFVKWNSPDGKRQIVASIDGSVAVIGNDERAVLACLAVRRGQVPSLAHQPDVEEMRRRVRANDALAFGYVSSANAARLLPELAPLLLLTRLPDEFKKCLAMSSPRILGGIGWSAHAIAGGIEDLYSISLKPSVLGRLRPAFKSNTLRQSDTTLELLPAETFSVTNYNFADPAAVWAAVTTGISSQQFDVLCAVGFNELSKKALISYGIDEPESFLRAVKPVVLTVRLDADSARSVVIAGVADEGALRQFVSRTFGKKLRTETVENQELLVSDDDQAAASFVDGYFMLGSPEDIRRCLSGRAGRRASGSSSAGRNALTDRAASADPPSVVTLAQDGERVRALVATLRKLRGLDSVGAAGDMERVIKALPYAVTETKLKEYGLERRTRSPLGQFSAFVSLLAPDQAH